MQIDCISWCQRSSMMSAASAPPAPPPPPAPPLSCVANAFDNGVWLPSSRGELFGSWRCPLWEPKSVRFNCANRAPFRRYSADFCTAPDAHDVLAPRGGHRTLFFVGDSLAEQHQRAVVCRMLRDAFRRKVPATLTMHGPLTAPEHKHVCSERDVSCIGLPRWVALLPDRPASFGPCTPSCSTVSTLHWSVTMCYVAAGTGYKECSRRAVEMASLLYDLRIARRGDVIFMNEGLWHNNLTQSVDNLESLYVDLTSGDGKMVNLSRAVSELGVGLVWRETSPQHFQGSASGSFVGRQFTAYQGDTCAPSAAVDEQHKLRAALLLALEDAGLPILRIWNLTKTQWDVHLDNRTSHVLRLKHADCTHFCEPSGVMEAWADGSLLLVDRLVRNLVGTW